MYNTSAVSFQHPAVKTGRITFVPVETVLRVLLVKPPHYPVPGHLGDDAGCDTGENFFIGFYNRLLQDG